MNIQQHYDDIYKFNEIGGTFEKPAVEMVDLYNSLGFEELSESIAAFENGDAVEILDGAIDEFVITCGKLGILENAGFNVQEALKRVCENNLSKFPEISTSFAVPENYTPSYNEKHNVIVLKNINGKIMKPDGFKKVDLSDLVPKDFL